MIEGVKRCCSCHATKPLAEFGAQRRCKDGRLSRCKPCYAEHQRRRRETHKGNFTNLVPVESKKCSHCKSVKPAVEFHISRSSVDGLTYICRDCALEWGRKHAAKSLGTRKHYINTYGITPQQAEDLFASQCGVCAICKRVPAIPCIDHDHATGVVRGVLCSWCNGMLAAIERPGFIEQALEYLTDPVVKVVQSGVCRPPRRKFSSPVSEVA